ncbi:sigma-70 family RNA polymerase sigma factor [Streptomyces sp. IB201691-2A2]|uniref:sigma-70 family RNA polymerase sigma factor n=1 Tax=Streptomyces sp. IB201691-2A2 TaxID=2561920 RepID=UPI0011805519|nr:sigma-70 family RNA polymerase sigma factor [Streptomyces sp. IB201691-2A2]TRO56022.1 sigma-70 family RNA polymerase sigma factor [Streptomyces sp. IB201691-2A2]
MRMHAQRATADEAVIGRLYAEHGNALLSYATRLTRDRLAAEDVVQETLIRAWRHPEALEKARHYLRGWLITVARNIVIDRFRAQAARPVETAMSYSSAAVQEDQSDALINFLDLMDALGRLTPAHREVLVEIFYRGHSQAEVAVRLGVAEGTVKSRAHRAMKALRQLYINAGDRETGPSEAAACPEDSVERLRSPRSCDGTAAARSFVAGL